MTRSPRARLRPLPLTAFRPEGGFWAPRLQLVREVTLRQQYEQCERTGRIDHFRRASRRKQIADFVGRFYDDSDVYKWLEACAYALATSPDPDLRALAASVIDEVAAAQEPDGYLNTYFTFDRAAQRWDNLTRMHQLYCAGHLIQAGIAHHRATGERTLVDVAIRFADLVCATFNAGNPNTDGHEEIELALVELYRHTGQRRYLDQAVFFLDQRGRGVLDGSQTLQDHLPVREQREIAGHAVRATYLATGMADAYAETHAASDVERSLWTAVESLWQSAFTRKAYVTGGLGAHWQGESFGADYDLPNQRAYAETCAAIGGFFWNWRMLLLTGDARHADWMETALYNGILSGLSLDGTRYFYQNPLASDGTHRRQEWFSTACCPPNIARLLLALPGYVATTSEAAVWVHQYLPGELRIGGAAGRVETGYPWDGGVRLEVTETPAADSDATLYLRIPAWCGGARLRVDGSAADVSTLPGAYAAVRRRWRRGDVVELDLPMPARRVYAHLRVDAARGRVALARGPIVHCVEEADHPGVDLRDVEIPSGASLSDAAGSGLLVGAPAIRTAALEATSPAQSLYGAAPPEAATRAVPLTAVPYFAWANREPGQMHVWLKER